MSRALHMMELRVALAERADYLAALPSRVARAAAVPAHFWVFEHASEAGRFVEFTEAANTELLAVAVGHEAASNAWRQAGEH